MSTDTGSLFTEEELFLLPQSGVIKLSTNIIRGASTVKKKEIIRGGKKVMISESTINDKRIEDTCIEIFQAKEISNRIDYQTLQNQASKELEPYFSEYGLVIDNANSKKKNTDIVEMQNIAVDAYIKKTIAESIPKEIRVPIKD